MSIRDILQDRQTRRQRDNEQQKEGYKVLLDYIARRRKEQVEYDVQQEEIKLMNGIKMHVDSGWVVDRQTLTELFSLSGINQIKEAYDAACNDNSIQLGAKIVPILQFSYKVAFNMGLPDFIELHESILPPNDPFEDRW